ncbi:CD276 antigen-like isoform X2 [Myripristis murdjan]|uniref:CD276 antigen-like isoform X2 n=1 Tax=Myripristis murdjan TaxID=586833 RepID=UPI0011761298|nr:CD276 antigen-like isoform X2 [Myripristis murdjan]
MTGASALVFTALLLLGATTQARESTVTCYVSEECVLPCSFQPDGEGVQLMWYKPGEALVSCTRHGVLESPRHGTPDEAYRGRTSLRPDDEVLRGNGSLCLRNTTVKDQGRYKCCPYTASNRDLSSYVTVVVKAPVTDVHIQLAGETVTCASTGIYPAPKLTWSTVPPSVPTHNTSTKVQLNHRGLYDITSSQRMMGNETGVAYLCSVTSDSGARTAMLKQQEAVHASGSGAVSIPCSALAAHLTQSFSLTWTFDHQRPIVRFSSAEPQPRVQDQWREQVKGLSVSGGLQLHRLTAEHRGVYSCRVDAGGDEYTAFSRLEVTDGHDPHIQTITIVAVVVLVLLLASAVGAIYLRGKQSLQQENRRQLLCITDTTK